MPNGKDAESRFGTWRKGTVYAVCALVVNETFNRFISTKAPGAVSSVSGHSWMEIWSTASTVALLLSLAGLVIVFYLAQRKQEVRLDGLDGAILAVAKKCDEVGVVEISDWIREGMEATKDFPTDATGYKPAIGNYVRGIVSDALASNKSYENLLDQLQNARAEWKQMKDFWDKHHPPENQS